MPTQQLSPPPARGVVRSIHGIECLNEVVKGGALEHVQLGRGVMDATLGHAPLDGAVLGFGQTEMPVGTRGSYNPVGHALGVILDMPRPGRFWGAETRPGSVLLCPPRTEADSIVVGSHTYAYLIVPPAVWEAAATALAPEHADRLLRARGVVHPPPAPARALTRRVAGLIRLLASEHGLAAEAAAAVREDLLGRFARAATAGEEAAEPCGRFFRHRRVVARAEDYLRDRLDQAVYTRELCHHCDVSERTLHYAFREVLGLTPMEYLRRRRLSAVRCELAAADPGPGVVARAAMRWGFWHLGEFATAYKALFGESPVDTLRRRKPGRPAV